MAADQIWALRNPDGGSQGLEFARARIAATERVLVHAAPERVDVEVFEVGGRLLATGLSLAGTEDTPMSLMWIDGSRVLRRSLWPSDDESGCVVLLPGGEAGILREWWNAPDQREWRWQLELSNRR